MSLILVVSILIRIAAFAWSVVVLRRLRDWRIGFLSAMLALMAVRQLLTLVATTQGWVPKLGLQVTELPGLAVSILAFLAVQGLARILESRRTQEATGAETRRMLQLVMDTIPQRVFWKDRGFRYLGCNRAFAQDAGLGSPEDIIGKSDFELTWHDSADRYRRDDRAVIERGVAKIDYEEPMERSDGTVLWLSTTKVPLRDRNGEIIGVFGSYEDITERKAAESALEDREEQLRHAQKMEVIGQLAGGVAHDFNNLLTAIFGHAELLLEQLPEGSPARADVEGIRGAAEHAASLTGQLLAFSRRQVVRPQVVPLNEALEQMEKLLRRILGDHVTLSHSLDPAAGTIEIDPGQLQQIVLNLAVNARDAMPEGGELLIETARLAAEGGSARDRVQLRVRDAGCGMTADVRERIFEPFFTTKGPGRGTGLGLSTVYGIVRQAGGSITVETGPGAGSTFTIFFSAAAEGSGPEESGPASPEGPPGTETVLLVEDEDMVRSLARRVLESRGYRVLVATDGKEALEVLRSAEVAVDIIVTDVVMPSLGGPDLVAQVRETAPDMPALFLSGHARHGSTAAELVGPDDVLLGKPFTPEALLTAVRRALESGGRVGRRSTA